MYNQVNKILFVGAVVFLLSASVFVACQSKQEQNAEKTTEALEVKSDSTWLAYKEASYATIASNDERIETLRKKIIRSNTPNLDKLRQKRIGDLQARNAALRTSISEHQGDSMEASYEQFKADVRQKMDEIEKELKELGD